jgi:hypothetical protein
MIPNSYQCRIVSPSSTNVSVSRKEETGDYNDHRSERSTWLNVKNNYPTTRPARSDSGSSTASRADASNWRGEKQQPELSNDRNNNPIAQASSTSGGNLISTTYIPPYRRNQEQRDGKSSWNDSKSNQHYHSSHKKK